MVHVGWTLLYEFVGTLLNLVRSSYTPVACLYMSLRGSQVLRVKVTQQTFERIYEQCVTTVTVVLDQNKRGVVFYFSLQFI